VLNDIIIMTVRAVDVDLILWLPERNIL